MTESDSVVTRFPANTQAADPERAAARREVRSVVERLIDELPEQFRVVFVMRAVEEMSVEETARILQLQPETVRTRFYRARQSLQRGLQVELASAQREVSLRDDSFQAALRLVDAIVAARQAA